MNKTVSSCGMSLTPRTLLETLSGPKQRPRPTALPVQSAILVRVYKERIRRTGRPLRDRNGRVPASYHFHSSFSFPTGFPFSPSLQGLCFSVTVHTTWLWFAMSLSSALTLSRTFQFRYPSSSRCHGHLCPRFLGVSSQLAPFH